MVRSAFLGCGSRARAHARAYRHVERGEIVAICDMNEELLGSFGDEFGIERRYTDLGEMLERERPDLLHIVTAGPGGPHRGGHPLGVGVVGDGG